MSANADFNAIYDLAALATHAKVLDDSLDGLRDAVEQTRALSDEERKFVSESLVSASIALNNVSALLLMKANQYL